MDVSTDIIVIVGVATTVVTFGKLVILETISSYIEIKARVRDAKLVTSTVDTPQTLAYKSKEIKHAR